MKVRFETVHLRLSKAKLRHKIAKLEFKVNDTLEEAKLIPKDTTREHTGKKRREGKNTISRAVVVTQLVEWSLPTSEIRSSNPVIVKLYMLTDNCCFENIKIIWNGPIKKLQFRAKIIEVKGRILIFGSLWKFL